MDGADSMYPPDGMDETTASKGSDEPTDNKPAEESETALLPKSILAGKEFNVGDEVVLKIDHIYEDEIEVSYAPEKPSEDNESMEGAQGKLDSMATESGGY